MTISSKNISNDRVYAAIDLKSFYASVECIERKLDPLTTNLVVADLSRTEKTICLAVSPSLKSYGISGRARLFEVVQRVKEVNREKASKAPNHKLRCTSFYNDDVKKHSDVGLDYIVAKPQMAHYLRKSAEIYSIYLKYISPEDIIVYSIDEVFIDLTGYLEIYKTTPHELTMKLVREVLYRTGITATAGIGSNLFLAKVAMDVVAKKMQPDPYGVRIAELDVLSYRREIWPHKPITDIWRVGRGYAKKLEEQGIYTMGDVARCSIGGPNDYHNEDLLYKLFGVNAETLIDHAWGYEPCTIPDIKAYKPETTSMGAGQVLMSAYTFEKGRIIVQEMVEGLILDLVSKGLVTNQLVLTISYDRESLQDPKIAANYKGNVKADFYGRNVPEHTHGTINFKKYTSSTREAVEEALKFYDEKVNPELLIRRVNVVAGHVLRESEAEEAAPMEQFSLFDNPPEQSEEKQIAEQKEKNIQKALLNIKGKYGKNAIMKGLSYTEGATGLERNAQIGGHRA